MSSIPKDEKLGIMPQIFAGGFDHDLIFPYPKMSADEAETVEMLLDSFDEFAKRKINPVKMDEEHETSPEVLKGLFDLGLMGLAIPEEYGGAGLSMTAYCKVMEAVGRHDASLAVTVGGHQSIGMKAILISGNEEQKAKYLPAVRRRPPHRGLRPHRTRGGLRRGLPQDPRRLRPREARPSP